MKLTLNESDIKLEQDLNGLWKFRLNGDIRAENLPTKEAALKHAEYLSKILIRKFIKKSI